MRNNAVLYSVVAVVLVLVAVAGRLLPHVWNATPVLAAALFAGWFLPWRTALFVPLSVLFITDLFIGFYDPAVMSVVYASFLVVVGVGYILRKTHSPLLIISGSITGSLFFFLTTNAAVWAFGTMYTKDLGGLLASYVAGIPFLRNMMVGDMIYTAVFFGLFAGLGMLARTSLFTNRKSLLVWQPFSNNTEKS